AQSRCELALAVAPEQPVEDRQEPGQGLAGAGRRDQQHVLARRDRRPGQPLRGSRSLGKGTGKPVSHRTRKRPERVPCFNVDRVHPSSDGTSWPHRLPLLKSIIRGLEDGPRAEQEHANERCKAWEQGDAARSASSGLWYSWPPSRCAWPITVIPILILILILIPILILILILILIPILIPILILILILILISFPPPLPSSPSTFKTRVERKGA